MAINTQAYSQHEFRLGIAEQSAFGTANTTQGDFRELHLTNRPELVSTPVEDNTMRATGSIVADYYDRYRTLAGGEFTIPIEGVLTKEQAAYLIHGCLQILTSEGETPTFTKLWTLGTSVAVPATPNFVFTTLIYDPSGKNIRLQDCVIKNLTLAFSPGAAGGRITYSGTIYSGATPVTSGVTATPGSWDSAGTTYYPMSSMDEVTFGTYDQVVAGWSITVDNGAKRYGYGTTGQAQGIAIGAGAAGISITGELVSKYDSASNIALELFTLSGAAPFAVTYNAASSSDLIFAMYARVPSEPKKDFGGDGGVMYTIPLEGVSSGATAALTVTLEDAIDMGW